MDTFLFLGVEVAAVFATILAGYLTLLFYRAPNHARWLEGDTVSTVVMIALMGAAIFSIAALVEGFITVLEDPLASIAAAAAVFAAFSWALWKGLRMRARLQAAEKGRSPFRLGNRRRAAV